MSRESETLKIVETIREVNFGNDKKPIENVQRPLVCTMELANSICELQEQLQIIEDALNAIGKTEKRIGQLNNMMNLDLNKYLKQNKKTND